jgi:hypothetical protein
MFLARMATPFPGKPFWKKIKTDYPERVQVIPVASPCSRVLARAFIGRKSGKRRQVPLSASLSFIQVPWNCQAKEAALMKMALMIK